MPKYFTYKGKDYNFSRATIRYTEVKKVLPRVLGAVAVNFFKDSFRRQGWRDKSLTKWEPRQKLSKGRAILIGRGHLRNSIRVNNANFERIEIGSNLPYATAHNDGFSGTVNIRAHTRAKYAHVEQKYTTRTGKERKRVVKVEGGRYPVRAHAREMNLPARQFMGDSEVLNMKIDQTIIKAVDTIFDF